MQIDRNLCILSPGLQTQSNTVIITLVSAIASIVMPSLKSPLSPLSVPSVIRSTFNIFVVEYKF